MSNVARYYLGYEREAQIHKQIAAELGMTPQQLLGEDFDLFDQIVSVDFPAYGQIHASFVADITMEVSYQPDTLTVTRYTISWNRETVEEWSGAMTAEQFLEWDWPPTTVYGSSKADWLWGENATIYAGAGNDIVEIDGSGVAYGQAGQDAFVLNWVDHGGNIRIADYRVGEKIYFAEYDSFEDLVSAFQGVSDASSNGFTLNFAEQYGHHWSLTIQGTDVSQMRLEDLLVGVAGADQIYAPVKAAFGIA